MERLRARACAELGDAQRAAEVYDKLLPFEGLLATPYLSTIWQDSAAYALGVLATMLRRWDRAEQHFGRALAAAQSLSSPTMIAPALERHGAMLLQRGRPADRAGGLALLQRAAEIAEQVGMRGVLERTRAHRKHTSGTAASG